VSPAKQDRIARDLAKLREVDAVYTTTGQSVSLRLTLESVQKLQSFLEEVVGKRGVELHSTQIITNVVKDEPPSLDPTMLIMNLKCDYCGGAVTSTRPSTLVAGSSHYYFCCKTCRRAYLDKFGPRLAKIAARALHS
ncbi:MAG: TRASH domain-containing protein, partial [Thaumarchaeota archaeon]|nr:TRASH domain-containing protein [Nitrososphaerota archaeon]